MSKAQFLAENLKPGETYAGLILGKDGQPDYHLFALSAKPPSKMTWSKAMAWAKSVGSELPNPREALLCFINAKEEFEPEWHWTCKQDAHYGVYAWLQDFDDGSQFNGHKSSKLRARAVRRLSIIE